jgi:hypothetical protein
MDYPKHPKGTETEFGLRPSILSKTSSSLADNISLKKPEI